jgi:hypothetical protein
MALNGYLKLKSRFKRPSQGGRIAGFLIFFRPFFPLTKGVGNGIFARSAPSTNRHGREN